MKEKNKFACMIYQDVFERMSKTFDDETLGRVLRAAFDYGFTGKEPELESPVENYACGELTSTFDRNRDSYNKRSRDGQIATAIQYSASKDDLLERLAAIDPEMKPFEQNEIYQKWKKKLHVRYVGRIYQLEGADDELQEKDG